MLRIATRASDLAIWQAEHVAGLLRTVHPDCTIELVRITTQADKNLSVPIAQIGGKGVFAKEIQQAVVDGRADIAVHSAKDLPAAQVPGLMLGAVPERGDARDALVGAELNDLAHGATVGTGSARRAVQLRALRPDLKIVGLRGNIAKRLSRIGELDAVVVAAVALERLNLDEQLAQVFSVEEVVPQVAQGALAIECRRGDDAVAAQLAMIEDGPSRLRVDAERAFLARLGGDCDMPAGAHATLSADGMLRLVGVLAPETHRKMNRFEASGVATTESAHALGTHVAQTLLASHGA